MTLPACRHRQRCGWVAAEEIEANRRYKMQTNLRCPKKQLLNDCCRFWRSVTLILFLKPPFSCPQRGTLSALHEAPSWGEHSYRGTVCTVRASGDEADDKARRGRITPFPPVPDTDRGGAYEILKPLTTLVFAKNPNRLMARRLDKHKRQASREIFSFGRRPQRLFSSSLCVTHCQRCLITSRVFYHIPEFFKNDPQFHTSVVFPVPEKGT